MKRTGLRRTPMKSSPMSDFERELAAMRRVVKQRSEGMCEYPGCPLVASVVHHRKRRSQGGTNELVNLMHLCRADHIIIHSNPARSYGQGHLLRSWELIK